MVTRLRLRLRRQTAGWESTFSAKRKQDKNSAVEKFKLMRGSSKVEEKFFLNE